jgi:hypothetical protein
VRPSPALEGRQRRDRARSVIPRGGAARAFPPDLLNGVEVIAGEGSRPFVAIRTTWNNRGQGEMAAEKRSHDRRSLDSRVSGVRQPAIAQQAPDLQSAVTLFQNA